MDIYGAIGYAPTAIGTTADVVERLGKPESLQVNRENASKLVKGAAHVGQTGVSYSLEHAQEIAKSTKKLYDASSSTLNFYNQKTRSHGYSPGSIIHVKA
ncbi:hypothetical protein [Vibrio astriarenae]|uniref:hypothetical protein n=1 Tax=Vibrio astriarenae TaxID=1481923 RepID=UPI003735EB5D